MSGSGRWFFTALAGAFSIAITGVVLAVTPPENTPLIEPVAASPAPTSIPATASFPFELYTHCGVDEALVHGIYFEADEPLIGVAISAPPGWDNPYQRGTMTWESPDRAVFRDDRGHEVGFHARPGATGFKRICD